MTRDPNALVAFLESREEWSFGYGPEPMTHDCARFCGAGVEAVTGRNPLDSFTSEWTTRRGARRVISAHGGMAKAVSKVMTEVPVTLAQRGDVAMLQSGELLLFDGEGLVGVSPERGLTRVPRHAAVMAWTA